MQYSTQTRLSSTILFYLEPTDKGQSVLVVNLPHVYGFY